MLTYDDRLHVYVLDGTRIPSVTQALKLAGLIDARFYTPEAAARGTAVHALCQYADGGGMPIAWSDVPYGVEAYAEAYDAFRFDTRIEYAGIEKMNAHPDGSYAGRCDRDVLRSTFGGRGKLEIKTGGEEEWHGYQLALYQLMDPQGERWAVYLQANGRYRLRRKFSADDYRTGRRAVADAWQAMFAMPEIGRFPA